MKLSELIAALEKHHASIGDVPVHVVVATHEYGINSVGFTDRGPLPQIASIRGQSSLPMRIVLEARTLDCRIDARDRGGVQDVWHFGHRAKADVGT